MPWSVYFITVALCFYTLAIWSEKIAKHLSGWMVWMMAIGFSADLIGTTKMMLVSCALAWHSFFGYLALVIMGLHLYWAIRAWQKMGRWAYYFNRCSIYAWLLWLAAFISGIPRIK